MSQPHEQQRAAGRRNHRGTPSSAFRRGSSAASIRFRERYGLLLEQAIARRDAFVTISLAIALGSLSLFFFLGRDYFPEIRSGVIQMHMRAPLGTRIEVSGRIATLVSEQHRGVAARSGRKHRQ